MSSFSEPCSLYMSSPVYSVAPEALLADLRDKLLQLRISGVAVIDPGNNQLLGIVTRTDLYRAGTPRHRFGIDDLVLPEAAVETIMSRDPITVRTDTPIADAARVMVGRKIHRVLVCDESGVVGVLSTRDVMRVVADSGLQTPLYDIMSTPVLTARVSQTIGEAVHLMDDEGVSGLVVLDQGWPCGILTHEEILAARRLDMDSTIEKVMNPAMLMLPMDMPVNRCAANAASIDVRRVLACRGFQVAGIASGLDFCRMVSAGAGSV